MDKNEKVRVILASILLLLTIGMNFSFINNVSFVEGYLPGVRKNWSYSVIERINLQPIIRSIDYDETQEIIFTAGTDLYCLSNTGEKKWIRGREDNSPYPRFVTVDNIAYDSSDEVILSSNTKLLVYDYQGLSRWGYNCNSIITNKATTADLNNDLFKEVLFVTDDGHVHCLNCLGNPLWNIYLGGTIYSDIIFTDFETDNQLEILVGGGYQNHNMHCLNYNGTLRWEFSTGGEVRNPIVCDLNGDLIDEIVFASLDGNIYCLNSLGHILWSYSTLYYPHNPVISDINGDNMDEVIFFDEHFYSTRDLICLSSDGLLLWKIEGIEASYEAPTIYDIDENNKLNILYSTIEGLECRTNTTEILFAYKPKNPCSTLIQPIVYDYLNDDQLDILYINRYEIISLRVYNKSLFYGVYLLPVYLLSAGLIFVTSFLIHRGVKTGKISLIPRKRTHHYNNEDGTKIYFEK